MTRMTGSDCAVVCNLINIHTNIHTYIHIGGIQCLQYKGIQLLHPGSPFIQHTVLQFQHQSESQHGVPTVERIFGSVES